MLDSGGWFTARPDGVPYLEKAPLKDWMIALPRESPALWHIRHPERDLEPRPELDVVAESGGKVLLTNHANPN